MPKGFIILTKLNRIIALEQLFSVLFLFTLFQIVCCIAIAYVIQTTAYLAWGGECVQISCLCFLVCLFVFKFSLYMVRPLGTIIDPEREDHTLARNPGMGDIMERTL